MSNCCTPGLYIGATGRILRSSRTAFTPDTAAFSTDQGMTDDELSYDCAVAEPGRTGILDAVIVRETADTGSPQKAPMRLVIAKANPAVSEHTAYTVDAIDNVLGIIDIASGDYEDLDGSHAIARIDTTINLPLDGTTVWVGAIAQGAVTYAASANIDIELQIISD